MNGRHWILALVCSKGGLWSGGSPVLLSVVSVAGSSTAKMYTFVSRLKHELNIINYCVVNPGAQSSGSLTASLQISRSHQCGRSWHG